jgi:hypothetical protein
VGNHGFPRDQGAIESLPAPSWDRRSAPAHEVAALNQPAPYLHWGIILISLPNLGVILFMVLLFLLALFLPFPGRRRRRQSYRERDRDR